MGWVSSIGKQLAKAADSPPVAPVVQALEQNAAPAALGGGIGALLPAETPEQRLANIAALAGGAVTARTMLRAPKVPTEAERFVAGPGVEAKRIFAGEGSAKAPLDRLERAKVLEDAGLEPKAIWKETGWLRGEEGAWKYEIDDSKAAMIVDPPKMSWEFDLETMFDHPELFEAYPELRKAQIMFKDMGPVQRDATGEIVQGATGAYDAFFRTVIINNRLTREEAAEAITHEVQHGVQDIEGFARGGEPKPGKEFMDTPEIERAMIRLGDLKLKHDRATDPMQKQMILAQMNSLKAKIQEQAEIEYYRRLPGEVEARVAEKRRTMSEQQRAGVFPKDQYDVAAEQILPDMGGGQISQQLIGPKAKSANKEILNTAKKMAKERVKVGKGLLAKTKPKYTRQQIWDETAKLGQPWYQDADGNWISEIEDGAIVVREDKGRFDEVIEFPSIVAEYPELGKLKTDARTRRGRKKDGEEEEVKGTSGWYRPGALFGVRLRVSAEGQMREYTLTHEVQHAVDDIEGRKMGGGKSYFNQQTERRAFNTMYRRLMSMEERIARPPWETEDEAVRWWGAWRDMEAAPAKFTPPGTPDPGPTIVPAEKTMPQARPDENVPEAAGNRDLGMEGEIVRGIDYGGGKRADMKIHAPITALLGRTFLSVRELVRAATKNEQLAEIVGTATSRTRAEENKAVKAAEAALSDRLIDMDAPLEAQPASVRAFFEQMIEEQQARPDLVEGGYDYTQPGYFDGLRLSDLIRELAFAQSAEAGIRDPMVDMIQRLRAAGIVGGKYVPGGRKGVEGAPPDTQSIVIFDERAPALLTDQSGNLMSRRGGPLMDEVGPAPTFYSALGRFISNSSTARAPAAQWKGMITNAPGVKAEEVEWSGVMDWLDAQDGPVTREDVAAFVAGNGVRVEEVSKGMPEPSAADARRDELQRQLLPLIERRDQLQTALDNQQRYEGWITVASMADRMGLTMRDPRVEEAFAAQPAYIEYNRFREETKREVDDLTSQINVLQREQNSLRANVGDTKWSTYTLPGGENYREMLLTLPVEQKTMQQWRVRRADGQSAGLFDSEESAQAWIDQNGTTPGFLTIEREKDAVLNTGFRSSHWSELNVLAHVRFKERTGPNGERVLALEEVQSDWHQAGREQGYKPKGEPPSFEDWYAGNGMALFGEPFEQLDARAQGMARQRWEDATRRGFTGAIPDAPFKNNAWANLVLKRMIRYAAENGFDAVAWIPGNVQNGRIVDVEDNRADFYDKIVPNLANKLGKKYGAKATQAPIEMPAQARGTGWENTGPTRQEQPGGPMQWWTLPLTPELRTAAMEEGFPMFSRRGGPLMDEFADEAVPEPEYRMSTAARIGEGALWGAAGLTGASGVAIAMGWDGIQRTEPPKPPEDMSPAEFARWKAQEEAAMRAEQAAANEQREPAPVSYNPLPMTPEAKQNMAQTEEALALKERRRKGLE